ncbi:MAG TPA: glycosyltransferase [Planctomycetaceae bacterium]
MNPIICPFDPAAAEASQLVGAASLPAVSCPGLSLILPAYNESLAIRHSIRAAAAALAELGVPYEIIVVDDGSTDDTAAVSRREARELPHVRVLSTPENVGYGGALRYGFREARFDFLAFTDADGQFDLRELARLLVPAKEFDLVCGYRIDRQDHWSRKLYSRGYNLLVRALLGTRVRDCDCALKIFRRTQIEQLGLESNDFFINAELLTKARLAGLTVTEVGVNHYPRLRGESKVSLGHIFPVLKTLLRFWWSKVLFSSEQPTVPSAISRGGRWAACFLLGLFSCLLILPNLSYPLVDPDEGRYAEISREMLESGDYVVPTQFGKPYLDKPPLLYWMTAASFQVFGISETAARLVPALAALLTIAAVYGFGSRLFGHTTAWLAGLGLLSCCGFLVSGRFVFIDTLLTLFTTVGLLAGCLACRQTKLHTGWWAAAALACALGTLAKGPIALVLCLPPLVAGRWLTGLPAVRMKHWAWFACIVGTLTIPWFLMVDARQPGFLFDFIWTHHFDRFRTGLAHEEAWWYYIPVLLIGMAPCSILLPAITTFLLDSSEAARARRSSELGLLVLAAAWTLLLFSLSACKLPPYVLPAIPLICLVVGRGLEVILGGPVNNRFLNFVRQNSPRHIIFFLLAQALITAGIDLFALDGFAAGRATHWAILVAAGALVAGGSQLRLWHGVGPSWGAALALAFANMGVGVLDFYPGVATWRSTIHPVVEMCHDEIGRATPVVCYGLAHEADSLAFRLGCRQVQNYQSHETKAAIAALTRVPEIVVLAHTSEVHDLYSRMPPGLTLAELGRHQHVFIGVCTAQPHVAASK